MLLTKTYIREARSSMFLPKIVGILYPSISVNRKSGIRSFSASSILTTQSRLVSTTIGTDTNPTPLISILFGKEAGLETLNLLFFFTNSHRSSATNFDPKASKLIAKLDFPDPELPTIKTPESTRDKKNDRKYY